MVKVKTVNRFGIFQIVKITNRFVGSSYTLFCGDYAIASHTSFDAVKEVGLWLMGGAETEWIVRNKESFRKRYDEAKKRLAEKENIA